MDTYIHIMDFFPCIFNFFYNLSCVCKVFYKINVFTVGLTEKTERKKKKDVNLIERL